MGLFIILTQFIIFTPDTTFTMVGKRLDLAMSEVTNEDIAEIIRHVDGVVEEYLFTDELLGEEGYVSDGAGDDFCGGGVNGDDSDTNEDWSKNE